jgi:hypothetical protein
VRDLARRRGPRRRKARRSLREAVEWCGSGAHTVREVTRLRQLAQPAKRQRPMSARSIRRLATRSDIRAATRAGVVAATLGVELNGVDGGSDDAFASRVAADAAPPGAG